MRSANAHNLGSIAGSKLDTSARVINRFLSNIVDHLYLREVDSADQCAEVVDVDNDMPLNAPNVWRRLHHVLARSNDAISTFDRIMHKILLGKRRVTQPRHVRFISGILAHLSREKRCSHFLDECTKRRRAEEHSVFPRGKQ
jgi:hypothetical protein